MDLKIKRRSFLKRILSLSAFSAGSILPYNGQRGFRTGNLSPVNMGPSEAQAKDVGTRVKKIAIEEHANEQDFEQFDKRLRDMDEAGIDMQVLSFVGSPDSISAAKSINETLAKIVEKYPGRFAAFATLVVQDPDAAANELKRAVKELGMKGTMIFSGEYLDEQKYSVILETAAKLDVPIYLHQGGMAPVGAREPYLTYPVLTGAIWEGGASGSLRAMRLIFSGTFDKYPSLKIIMGHMGEGIPYFLWRIDNRFQKEKEGAVGTHGLDSVSSSLKKKPSQYFKDNFYVTTSGVFWDPVLQFTISVLGAERILFAVDYPPESCNVAVQFIESAPISDTDKEKICHLNSEKLFKL